MAYDLTRFFDTLRIRLPGALDGVLYLETFNAIEELCTRSNAYTEDITLTTISDVADYPLTPADTTHGIIRLIFVYDENNLPVPAYMPTVGTVTLLSMPTSSGTDYTCTVALSPNEIEDPALYPTMPDWFWTSYMVAIQNGVIAKMMSQQGKPYSNLSLARYHGKLFQQGINEAKTQTMHGNGFRGQNWAFPGGFR